MNRLKFVDSSIQFVNQRNILTRILTSFTCNISLVNGTAFITNPSVDLTKFLNNKITITAGGKTLVGWIKASGTGETLGSEINGDTGFDNAAYWDKEAGWTVSGSKANATDAANGNGISKGGILTSPIGKLYKSTFDIDSISEGGIRLNLGAYLNSATQDSSGSKTIYLTPFNGSSNDTIYLLAILETTAVLDNLSVKQVLTPSSTGVTIVSTRGGTTYNWISDDGINPNSSSFTVTITEN